MCDALCITTNGYLKSNGRPVMGRGVALQAKQNWPWIESTLGEHLRNHQNTVGIISDPNLHKEFGAMEGSYPPYYIVSLPVKPEMIFSIGNNIVRHQQSNYPAGRLAPGWAAVAIPELIEISLGQLVSLTNKMRWSRVCLPWPGCGAGELSKDQIRPMLTKHLDDRFIIVSLD